MKSFCDLVLLIFLWVHDVFDDVNQSEFGPRIFLCLERVVLCVITRLNDLTLSNGSFVVTEDVSLNEQFPEHSSHDSPRGSEVFENLPLLGDLDTPFDGFVIQRNSFCAVELNCHRHVGVDIGLHRNAQRRGSVAVIRVRCVCGIEGMGRIAPIQCDYIIDDLADLQSSFFGE